MSLSRNEISLSKINSIVDKFYAYSMAEIIKSLLDNQTWAEVVFENRLKEISNNIEIMQNPPLNPLVYKRRQTDLSTYENTLAKLNNQLIQKEVLSAQELFLLSTIWLPESSSLRLVDADILYNELLAREKIEENPIKVKLLICLGHYYSYQFSYLHDQAFLKTAIDYYLKASNLGNHRATTYLASHYCYCLSSDNNAGSAAALAQFNAANAGEANALMTAGRKIVDLTDYSVGKEAKIARIDESANYFFKALNQGIILPALNGLAKNYLKIYCPIRNKEDIAAQIIALCLRQGGIVKDHLSKVITSYQVGFYESSYQPMVSLSPTFPSGSNLVANKEWFNRVVKKYLENKDENQLLGIDMLINEHLWGDYLFKIGSPNLTYEQIESDTIYVFSTVSKDAESKDSETETLHCVLKNASHSILQIAVEPNMMLQRQCLLVFFQAINNNSIEYLTSQAKEDLLDYLSRINVVPRESVFSLFFTTKLAHMTHKEKLANIAKIEFYLESGRAKNKEDIIDKSNLAKSIVAKVSSFNFNICPLERKKIDTLKIRFNEERDKKYRSTLFSPISTQEANNPSILENNFTKSGRP